MDDMQVYYNLGNTMEGANWSVQYLLFPIDFEEVKEKIGLNDEYEEYAIQTTSYPYVLSAILTGELNRSWEMVSELPEEYNRSYRVSGFTHFSSIEEPSEHRGYYHSFTDDMYDVARYHIEEMVL